MKTKILILFFNSLLTFHVLPISSQPVQQEWVARYVRHPGQVMGPFFALDKNGNSYVAGDDLINDSINILVIKYNSSGQQLWATLYKYPGFGYFFPVAIALDTFGNPYVTTNYSQTALSAPNILTIKFNSSNGSVIWAKTYVGVYGASIPEDMKIDKLNNIYVVGHADSSLLCIKYNFVNGDSIWVRKYHPPGDYGVGHACTIDDSLNIIITGERDHCISFPPPGGCYDTLLTVKYSKDGIFRWSRTYFNPVNPFIAYGSKVVTDQFGNIYIGGTTRNGSGWNVYLTVKYDRNGVQQWVSIYDGPGVGDDFLKSIALDRIHNYVFITGSSTGINYASACATIKYNTLTGDSVWVRRDTGVYHFGNSNDITIDTSGNTYITGVTGSNSSGAPVDILSIKYSSQGLRIWQITYNGPANGVDIGNIIELDNSNNFYICGSSQGNNFQESDYIVIKYNQPIGIKRISKDIPNKFELYQNYPNPFNPTTKIRFTIPRKSFIQLKIYDVLGKLKDVLINQEMSPSQYEILLNGSSYTSDIYFYQLISDGVIIDNKKMILIR